MAASGAPTSIDTMTGAFPLVVEGISGEPTLKELIRIIDCDIAPCAQSHISTVHALNYLHLCIPTNLWPQYTNQPYPEGPVNPEPWNDGRGVTPLLEDLLLDGLSIEEFTC